MMINRKNLWFLTLFSLILVLSIYYVTMPKELLVYNGNETSDNNIEISEASIIDVLREEDNTSVMEEINKLKMTISDNDSSIDDKNMAFDKLKILNQISSKEEILEEKIKNTYDLNSFIKIDGDQIRVVVDCDEGNTSMANNIMKTIQNNFDSKQYIVVQFK